MLPFTGFFIPSSVGGGGVSGLSTADGGTAIADNALIRGDGTTGIQGGVLTSADHNGDIAGPTTSSDTTAVGIAYTNQPTNDSVQILSSDAGDVAVDITIIGTTTGTDTVVVEVLATDATDGTTPVTSVKTNWGQILAIKKAVTTGTITIQKTTGPATVTTLLAAATSSGVSAASNTANAWNRTLSLVGSGATTKQVGIKGTNSSGTTIYDSQALSGTTAVASNSSFVEVHEFYIGDLEATRTLTASTRGGVGINDDLLLSSGADIRWSTDTGLARSAAGVVKVTDGSTGDGSVRVAVGSNSAPAYSFSSDTNTGFGIESTGGSRPGIIYNGDISARFDQAMIEFPSNGVLAWGNQVNTFASSSTDTYIRRPSAGSIDIQNAINGQRTGIKTSATTVNLTGATTTATGLFPAKCIQLGVTVRVTTLAASGDGGTSMNIGDGSDVDRYGATIAFAAGTTVNLSNATADPRGWSASAGDVVFTCVGGTFNAGVVRVVAHYIDLTAPTS